MYSARRRHHIKSLLEVHTTPLMSSVLPVCSIKAVFARLAARLFTGFTTVSCVKSSSTTSIIYVWPKAFLLTMVWPTSDHRVHRYTFGPQSSDCGQKAAGLKLNAGVKLTAKILCFYATDACVSKKIPSGSKHERGKRHCSSINVTLLIIDVTLFKL